MNVNNIHIRLTVAYRKQPAAAEAVAALARNCVLKAPDKADARATGMPTDPGSWLFCHLRVSRHWELW